MGKAVSKKIGVFQKRILQWYSENGRDFPWRNIDDPYKILIAEILLQKTTSEQVNQIYTMFIKEFPDIDKILKSRSTKITKYFETLGMGTKKSKVLKNICFRIKSDFNGIIPDNQDDLLSLPGVGRYTANALLCFAFGDSTGILDTNIVRILERVFELRSDKSRARTDPEFWIFSTSLVPKSNPQDFNYGLLDFAALICKKRNPKCDNCPLTDICAYYIEMKKTFLIGS